jgi:phage baseplate assembly protein W
LATAPQTQPDFLGTGWAFPVRRQSGTGIVMARGEDKIRQSLALILSTAPGERLMRPEFGCGIYELVFMPNTAALRGMVQEQVREAIVQWEPRVNVVDVRVQSAPDAPNYLLIRIDYQVRSNNAVFNLVYPFFLNEGASLSPNG